MPLSNSFFDNIGFAYGTHRWDKQTPFPPLMLKLKQIAERLTRLKFDCVLLKVYTDGVDSLGMHQDTDGSPQHCACFTIVSRLSALRLMEIYPAA